MIAAIVGAGLLVFSGSKAATADSAGSVETAPAPGAATPVAGQPFRAPLAGALRVVRAFDAPATAYGAGHRGVDLGAGSAQPVLAANAGRVSFAGEVAGRGVVVIAHAGAISTEYEPIQPSVRVGQTVQAGQLIGRLAGSGCPPATCLHWGAKRNGEYFDPLTLLRPLAPVRLLPLRGPPTPDGA